MLDRNKNRGVPKPYLRNLNVRWFDFDLSDVLEMKFEPSETDRYSLQRGDVAICEGGYPGRAAIWEQDEPIFIQKAIHRVRFHEPQRAKWFVYYLSYCDAAGTLKDHFSGSGIQHFTGQALAKFRVPLPPLEEQQRIVAILDEAFEGLDRARANAEANLQSARELFESHREQLLDPSNRPGWAYRQLSTMIEIKHGFAFKSAYFVDTGQHAVLTPGNFHETGGFRDRGSKQRYYAGDYPPDFLLNEGELLMAMTEQAPGLLGSSMIVPESNGYLHNQRLGLITPKTGVPWHVEFFAHAFNLKAFRKGLSDTCSGATVRHTSPGRILALSVPFIDDLKELEQVATNLAERERDCDNLRLAFQAKLQGIADLRQSLLQKAFAGELTSPKPHPVLLPANDNMPLSAQILALGYSRHQSAQREKTYGHVKAQKLLHLAETICGYDLGRIPIKDAAGPNDMPHMRRVEDWAKTNQVFEFQRRPLGGYTFVQLEGFSQAIRGLQSEPGNRLSRLVKIIDLLVPMDKEDAEVLATVHAAWSNLIIDGVAITDELIVTAAREDWHPDKMKIERPKFFDAIRKIKSASIEPNGTARYVEAKQARLL
ncbi:hypothetical protein HNQ96_006012 [Aminobacter lissarensis]|uniref:Type I restriction modification DNA specificity domain-containing protein n=1 Tax=Aminobacter carboxidus TaxID=376165 RepID=A0A8E1WKD2_9HYPH|nr:restriction endonuclease subunit S [Aminobacter lissarensis]MBB6470118.1 hypothetical protein [Aminobacter lissarensis]